MKKKEKILLITILILGIILRVFLGLTTSGYTTDIACFKGWADILSRNGLSNIYSAKIFIDYPPGYLYVLFFIGIIQRLFQIGLDSSLMLLLLKTPAIIADLISSIIIFKLAKEKFQGRIPLALTFIYLLNPAVFINSAIWAQIDGFFTLFIVIMILYLKDEKLLKASFIFVVAVLIKPQAFIFTPILIYAFWESKDIKLFLKAVAYSFGLFVLLILPFSINQQPLWIVSKYINTLSSYAYATVNAYNLYGFIGANWAADSTKVLGISYKLWGSLGLFSIVVFSTYIYIKAKASYKLQYIAFFIITATFMISTKMHERYIFPALILALLWYIYSKDKNAIFIFILLSITAYVNQASVLYAFQTASVIKLVSFANLVIFIWVVKIGLGYCRKEELIIKKNAAIRTTKLQKTTFVKKDYILISVLVFVYSLLAFINLGWTKTPQSFWKATSIGESFYVDFGKIQNIDKVSYYPGLGQGEYEISYATDMDKWSKLTVIDEVNIYNWQSVDVNKSARYVKITVNKANGRMLELGFFNSNKVALKVKEVKLLNISNKDEGGPEKLFDEQKFLEETPSYLTGMIFDEIYHARTAYEQINKLEMYEWTHPPLGKLIIAIGIKVFGMNPFGWRVMGTLFGIAMIPFMYFLGKKLFRKTEYAFISALLMATDCMHFTQTRIATIDVYAVFFIILMYYYMFKFTEIDIYMEGLRKTLVPLALCGTFFAIGVATKWICIYSAVGLAILFFKEIYDRYLIYKIKKLEDLGLRRHFKVQMIKTIIFCIIFFIVLPIVVYMLAYIPFMMIPGPGHGLKDVISLQKQMYDYHTKLNATHFFESPWWQWPLMLKPIWYYSGQKFLPSDKISSIVAMGNPAIWWIGVATFLTTIYIGIKERDKIAFFIVVSALSQYLPWVLVPRLTFIYHYFATLPFIMFSIVYVLKYFRDNKIIHEYYMWVYLSMVMLMFILFYPVASGMVVSKNFVGNFLRWFSGWYFYN